MLQGSILQKLVTNHQVNSSGKGDLSFGVYYKNTLVALCHALEDCVLAADTSPLIITAFQRGKWYLQEADRYGDMADQSQQIVIMAAPESGFHQHPTSQRANVALVDLAETDPVAQEWHLMILSPSYTAMVLCQELSPDDYGIQGVPSNDLERKFYGFWTFDPALVQETIDLAIAHIGRYDLDLQTRLMDQSQQIAAAIATDPAATTMMGLDTVVTRIVDYLQTSSHSLLSSNRVSVSDILNQNLLSNELQAFLRMAQLVDLADPINPLATSDIAALADMMGQLIDLPAWQLQRLTLASLLHRVAPLQTTGSPEAVAPCCPLVPGAQVLRTMPRLRAVAQIITHQTEWWNGSGQPAGITGDSIPLESRILGLLAWFQARVVEHQQTLSSDEANSIHHALDRALADCQSEAGQRWDPKLVEILALMVGGLQQGLSLPAIPSRISLGSGLLNPEFDQIRSASPTPAYPGFSW